MPPFYDIYGFSKQRDKNTVEKFLSYFAHREKIENRTGQEIIVYKNDKYGIEETWIPVNSLTDVIEFALENVNFGFAFYISDNLREGINDVILKFTFDGKVIYGISVKEKIVDTLSTP